MFKDAIQGPLLAPGWVNRAVATAGQTALTVLVVFPSTREDLLQLGAAVLLTTAQSIFKSAASAADVATLPTLPVIVAERAAKKAAREAQRQADNVIDQVQAGVPLPPGVNVGIDAAQAEVRRRLGWPS